MNVARTATTVLTGWKLTAQREKEYTKGTKMCGIYVIRNTANGRLYVGRATNVEGRWKQHRWDLNGGRHSNKELQKDWIEYGPNTFIFEMLETYPVCTSLSAYHDLCNRESIFIKRFRSEGVAYNGEEGAPRKAR